MIRPGRGPVVLIPMVVLLGVLVGCGSSSNDSTGVASAGGAGNSAPTGSSAAAGSPNDPLGFARCLRSHGVNVPDPDPNAGLASIVPDLQKAMTSQGSAKVQSAMQGCRQYLSGLAQEKGTQQYKQAMFDYVNCLQSHGAKVDDPDPNTGRPDQQTIKAIEHPDATMQKAMDACADKKPGVNQ